MDFIQAGFHVFYDNLYAPVHHIIVEKKKEKKKKWNQVMASTIGLENHGTRTGTEATWARKTTHE